jgi:hypothetical protein
VPPRDCPDGDQGVWADVAHTPITFMSKIRLKIDVSGTIGNEAWHDLKQFDEILGAAFGPKFGSSGSCNHAPGTPHGKGEWVGAEIELQSPLLAQYALAYYLEQERVLDADVVE